MTDQEDEHKYHVGPLSQTGFLLACQNVSFILLPGIGRPGFLEWEVLPCSGLLFEFDTVILIKAQGRPADAGSLSGICFGSSLAPLLVSCVCVVYPTWTLPLPFLQLVELMMRSGADP